MRRRSQRHDRRRFEKDIAWTGEALVERSGRADETPTDSRRGAVKSSRFRGCDGASRVNGLSGGFGRRARRRNCLVEGSCAAAEGDAKSGLVRLGHGAKATMDDMYRRSGLRRALYQTIAANEPEGPREAQQATGWEESGAAMGIEVAPRSRESLRGARLDWSGWALTPCSSSALQGSFVVPPRLDVRALHPHRRRALFLQPRDRRVSFQKRAGEPGACWQLSSAGQPRQIRRLAPFASIPWMAALYPVLGHHHRLFGGPSRGCHHQSSDTTITSISGSVHGSQRERALGLPRILPPALHSHAVPSAAAARHRDPRDAIFLPSDTAQSRPGSAPP